MTTERNEKCEALLVEMNELADRIRRQDLFDFEINDLGSHDGRIIDNGVVWFETDHDIWTGLWGWVGSELDPDMAHPVIVKLEATESNA